MHSFLPLLPNPPRPKSSHHLKMFSRAGHHLVLRENVGERFLYLVKRRRREQCNMLCMFLHSLCSAFRTIRTIILGSHAHNTYIHTYHILLPSPPKCAFTECNPISLTLPQPTQNNTRSSRQLGPPGLPLAHDLWPRLLRCRNDAPLHPALRPRQTRNNFPRIPSPIGRDDCSGHAHKQDGSCTTPSVRPNAGPALGDFDG